MPNHVTNIMTVTGPAKAISELKAVWFCEGKPDKSSPELPDMIVDFNGIVPMPKELQISSGSMSSDAENWLSMQDDWVLSGEEMSGRLLTSKLKKHTEELLDWQTDTVGHLKALVEAEPGLLEKIGLDRQYIEQIKHNLTKYGCPTWYEWCVRHWGTKWNAYHQHISDWSDTSFCVTFDTAWSPPQPVFETLVESFPEVRMEILYIDEGCGFAGTFIASDGDLTDIPCEDGDLKSFAEENFGWEFDSDDDE